MNNNNNDVILYCFHLQQYNTAGLKEKQSHTNKDTHSKLHYWKLVKENGIKEF